MKAATNAGVWLRKVKASRTEGLINLGNKHAESEILLMILLSYT